MTKVKGMKPEENSWIHSTEGFIQGAGGGIAKGDYTGA